MKHVKELIISDEIANQDVENTTKNVKSSEDAKEVVNEMETIIRSNNKHSVLRFAYQQIQIFERFKLNDNFMNMVNQFGNSDVINTINETIVALKIDEKRKII